jgi:OmpA-OmpF porin, OOP family
MFKALLSIFIFLNALTSFCQTCIFNDDGECIAKGQFKTIKHKTSYGAKYTSQIRKGNWQFFNSDASKKASGGYNISQNFSTKEGEWQFYNQDGQLLFKRWYNNGVTVKTQFFDTGYLFLEGDSIVCQSDSMGSLNIEEKKGNLTYQYQVSAQQIINGEIYRFAKTKKAIIKTLEIPDIQDGYALTLYPEIKSTLGIRSWSVNNLSNLINNGDFEAMTESMTNNHTNQIAPIHDKFAKYWGSANETPDLFKKNDNCYAGYRVFGVNYEVLRNELKKPLVAGKQYCLQFKLKLKYENDYAINGVSAFVGNKFINILTPSEGLKQNPILQTHPSIILACKQQWMTISGSFTAYGGETYLYLGNFTPKEDLRIKQAEERPMGMVDEIYYYIDDIVLIEEQENSICPCNVKGCNQLIIDTITNPNIFEKPEIGQTLVLKNIQFETAKWNLLSLSYKTLDSLVILMQNFPAMKVEISGHTDNKGDKTKNEILSLNRALAVVEYLISQGIEEERLSHIGHGQNKPIDTNETEEGRLNNRRVEFKIIAL